LQLTRRWEALGAKFLLGYNEPDGDVQTCSPAEGARKWITVQKIANSFDPPLRLVSPSPCSGGGPETKCPNGGMAKGSSPWLNEFFAKCTELEGCNPDGIEFIGMHDYEGDFDIRDDNLQVRIENAANNYRFSSCMSHTPGGLGPKRQVWITELGVGCGKKSLCRSPVNREKKIYRDGNIRWPTSADDSISAAEHLWYQKQVIPYLEKSEHVFRYAWWGLRRNTQNHGFPALLPHDDEHDDTPTDLGQHYMTAEEVQ